MLLTLFLVSSAGESLAVKSGTLSAGFPGKNVTVKAVEKEVPLPSVGNRNELDYVPVARKGRIPTRSIDFDANFAD